MALTSRRSRRRCHVSIRPSLKESNLPTTIFQWLCFFLGVYGLVHDGINWAKTAPQKQIQILSQQRCHHEGLISFEKLFPVLGDGTSIEAFLATSIYKPNNGPFGSGPTTRGLGDLLTILAKYLLLPCDFEDSGVQKRSSWSKKYMENPWLRSSLLQKITGFC